MSIIAKVWNWIKSLFGFGSKVQQLPLVVVTPAANPAAVALAEQLNNQKTPLSGAALAEQLNKKNKTVAPTTTAKPKVTKKITKKKG